MHCSIRLSSGFTGLTKQPCSYTWVPISAPASKQIPHARNPHALLYHRLIIPALHTVEGIFTRPMAVDLCGCRGTTRGHFKQQSPKL